MPMPNKSLKTSVAGDVDGKEYLEVTVELELEMQSELSGQQLAEILLNAIETDDRISIDFACTTTHRPNR